MFSTRRKHTQLRPRARGAVAAALVLLALAPALPACDTEPGAAMFPDAGMVAADAGAGASSLCNPLGDVQCLMPWPSSAYLTPDSSTITGYRVDIPAEAMMSNGRGVRVDPAPLNRFDGFGPSGVILAAFPGGVSAAGLPPHSDPAASLAPDSPIVIVNMETGERLPFFAEVDMNTDDPTKRTLLIHPLRRMAPATRYAVGIRNTVRAPGGGPLPVPAGFAAIRDGRPLASPLANRIVPRYPAIFAALAKQGVSKDDLVVAWDFVTASEQFLTGDLQSMRTQALAAMGDSGQNLSFDAQQQSSSSSHVLRVVQGTFEAPNFLTDGEKEDSVLRRGKDGLPAMSGMYTANFTAVIPACVATHALPIPVVIFGHGLFQNAAKAIPTGLVEGIADDNCAVFMGSDYIGLSDNDINAAVDAVHDANRMADIAEKLPQGVINFIALEKLARGPFGDSPLFQYQGASILDPSRVYYFGASLGAIMGGVLMAYEPVIRRGVLGVVGADWSLLLERSYAWSLLGPLMHIAYTNEFDYEMLVAMFGLELEPYDPITTATRVLGDPLPGTPPKQLLLYESVGDSLVNNLGAELFARTLGVSVTAPTVRTPFGIPADTGPLSSAFTIFNEHPSPLPSGYDTPPKKDNGTHEGIHSRAAVQREVKQFLLQGQASDPCEVGGQPAPCDCATGACD